MEEMNFMWKKLDSLTKDTDVWTRPANVKIEAGQVLLPVAGVYWDSPSTAVPALRRERRFKELSASPYSVYSQQNLCNGNVRTRVQQVAELRIWE